jgi:hypothetical protein
VLAGHADVATLGVEDDREALLCRLADHPFQSLDAAVPVPLEARRLDLHARHLVGNSVQETEAEVGQRPDGL